MEYLDQIGSDNQPVVKHHLRTKTQQIQIAEPVGFDGAKFVVKQDDKRYGRDVEFSPSDLTFNANTNFRGLDHQFNQLIDAYKSTGFESDWKYILEIEGIEYIVGQLDFQTAKTDELTYFTTNIIQQNTQAIIRSREDVEVNLFSHEDLDGNIIPPLETTEIYLRATPEKQSSTWAMYEPYYIFRGSQTGGGVFQVDFNPFPIVQETEIEYTLSPPINSIGNLDDFAIVVAENELSNVTLIIKKLNFRLEIASYINNFGFAYCQLFYAIGTSYASATPVEIFRTGTLRRDGDHSFVLTDQDFVITGLTIPRDQKLFLVFRFFLDTQNNPFTAQLFVDSGSVQVDAVSTSISSMVETFNLGDAMQHVIKSISGLGTDAPRFIGEKAEFKDQYITNGLLMRSIREIPFNLSLSKILDYLPEVNADYEIDEDKVFFGLYEDFYRNENIGNFEMPPNETFQTDFNQRYSVNKFNFKYNKYEKSNDESKSREGVHTEMNTLLPNKMVDNTKDVTVGFIRDTFLIESTRKESIKVKKDVATEHDNDIFIIDVVRKSIPIKETQQFTVYHKVDGARLRLLNDGSINWALVGFNNNDTIKLDFANAGDWIITGINPTRLTLIPAFNNNWLNRFEGYASTKFVYEITKTNLTNRTSEGFSVIEGTTTPDGFSNLRFTPKRNTLNYWGQYLATCCAYRINEFDRIRITEFIHNGTLETNMFTNQLNIIENADIITGDLKPAILSPKKTITTVICDFTLFWGLRQAIRGRRGFVEVSDTNGNTIQIYPKNIEFIWQDNLMEITGEVKSEGLIIGIP